MKDFSLDGSPSLASLQASFAESTRSGVPSGSFAATVEQTADFDREARLGVYAYAFESRLRGALEEDFEATAALLGEKLFARIVRGYLERYPSGYWSVGDVGVKFPVYLREREKSDGISPGVAELARFEWAVVESFYADVADSSLGFPDLASLPPERLAGARMNLDPSVKLFRSPWPVASLWQARAKLEPHRISRPTHEEFSLIHRTPRWVVAEVLTPVEFALLNAAQLGVPLGEWPAVLAGQALDLTKIDVPATFAKWRSDGILISVSETR